MYSSTLRLDGRTVIITGANTGIGKETARDLAQRGAKVILACRDTEKAENARQDIVMSSGSQKVNVIVKQLDLASMESIKSFAQDINNGEDKLHILINNAGLGGVEQSKTVDGFETTFGTNHLGPFLLTNLLMDKLKSSTPSRIVNVAAHAHVFAKINFDNLMLDGNYNSIYAYCQSKLANILFTRELAIRLKDTGVTSYSLHPGVINTELGRYLWIANTAFGKWVMNHFTKTTVEGAQTTIYCAIDESIAEDSGWYYSNCALSTPILDAFNDDIAKRIWEESAKLVNLTDTIQRVEVVEEEEEPEPQISDLVKEEDDVEDDEVGADKAIEAGFEFIRKNKEV